MCFVCSENDNPCGQEILLDVSSSMCFSVIIERFSPALFGVLFFEFFVWSAQGSFFRVRFLEFFFLVWGSCNFLQLRHFAPCLLGGLKIWAMWEKACWTTPLLEVAQTGAKQALVLFVEWRRTALPTQGFHKSSSSLPCLYSCGCSTGPHAMPATKSSPLRQPGLC